MLYAPVKFKPMFKERIWGSDRLKRLYNKQLPAGVSIGESWELADLADDKSIIENGQFAGMNIRQLLEGHGEAMGFSKKQCEFPFGLLIKFLDANDVLSVQVHPDSEICKKLPGAMLKTECWYVLEAEPESIIYRGLKPGVNKDKLERYLKEGEIEELMMKYPAKKGDFHFLPAGTIHALGAGIVVAEIQTPSDTTYRLYDWNRKDKDGRGRELHIKESLECIHYTAPPNNIPRPRTDWPAKSTADTPAPETESPIKITGESLGTSKLLIDCPYFSVVHVSCESGLREFSTEIPYVMIALSGSGNVYNKDDQSKHCGYNAGDAMLIPAMRTGVFETMESGEMLLVCL